MAGLTDFFVNKVIDHNLRGQSYTPPAAVYLQLHTGNPGNAGTAAVSAMSTRKAATFTSASGGSTVLAEDVTWSISSRETITHVSLWDASSGGNCLLTAQLEESKNVFSGDTFQLPMLSLSIPSEA